MVSCLKSGMLTMRYSRGCDMEHFAYTKGRFEECYEPEVIVLTRRDWEKTEMGTKPWKFNYTHGCEASDWHHWCLLRRNIGGIQSYPWL